VVVFGYELPSPESEGSRLIVNGAAALAAMLDGPSDLHAIERPLATWFDEQGSTFFPLEPLGT
jgi:hypothetical protein